MAATGLVVNPYSGVVHEPSCKHAAGCIPWQGFAATPSDKPCRLCKPDVEAFR
jgi:hypothetical protein